MDGAIMYRQKWEEQWIPDMLSWTQVGTCALSANNVLKINNILYMFGGVLSGSVSNKIYSTAWDNPTGWADTGITASGLNFGKAGIVNNTIYHYGASGANNTIWSASISTPLTWSSTGTTISSGARDNCGFAITKTHVAMIGGHNGSSATSNTNYALISSPTTINAGSTSPPIPGWERSSCYLDGEDIYTIGGVNASNNITVVNARNPGITTIHTFSTNFSLTNNPAIFHVGNYIWTFGGDGRAIQFVKTKSFCVNSWPRAVNVFPANIQYVGGSQWIGPDGYAYVINYGGGSPYPIYKSARKKIYVIEPAIPGIYTHRRAIDATTGAMTTYTVHCQMGMSPWFTNRRDRF